jgi:YbbR domain-containing protein
MVRIKNSDFSLPSGMAISSVTPSSIKIIMEKRVRKQVPVRVALRGRLPSGQGGYVVVSEPANVEIEGSAGQIARVDSVSTEDVDAGHLERGKDYRKNLLPLSDNVTVLRDDAVSVRLVSRKKSR